MIQQPKRDTSSKCNKSLKPIEVSVIIKYIVCQALNTIIFSIDGVCHSAGKYFPQTVHNNNLVTKPLEKSFFF